MSQSQKSANNKQIFEEVYFIDEEDYTLIDKLLTQSVNQSFIRKIADDNKNGANVETDPNIFKMAKERLGQSKLISSRGFMEA